MFSLEKSAFRDVITKRFWTAVILSWELVIEASFRYNYFYMWDVYYRQIVTHNITSINCVILDTLLATKIVHEH